MFRRAYSRASAPYSAYARVRALGFAATLPLYSAPKGTCACEMGRPWLLYLWSSGCGSGPDSQPGRDVTWSGCSYTSKSLRGLSLHPDSPDLRPTSYRLDPLPIQGMGMISAAALQLGGGGPVAPSEQLGPIGLDGWQSPVWPY